MAAKKSTKTAQSKAKAAKSNRGGRRSNSGRKPTAVVLAQRDLNAAVDGLIGAKVPGLLDNMFRLADGGHERKSETWELAASLSLEAVVRDADGNPLFDTRGNPVTAKQAAFPDAKPGEMVLTKRVVEVAEPDRAANEYLLNRRLGKPKQAVELSGPDGGAIPVSMESAIDKIYGEADDDGDGGSAG